LILFNYLPAFVHQHRLTPWLWVVNNLSKRKNTLLIGDTTPTTPITLNSATTARDSLIDHMILTL
jgi:hypothetical protein